MSDSTFNADDINVCAPSTFPWQASNGGRDIAVLMSGGVDSSVTAAMLQQQGWRVLGITMRIPKLTATCQLLSCHDSSAAEVCARLGISHYYLGTETAFAESVIAPFQADYAAGRTPNPCVNCNRELKFGVVWDVIERQFQLQHVATGHYVRIVRAGDQFRLQPSADTARDQSYFLYGIRAERLPFFHAPLADLNKTEVRRRAAELGMAAAERSDSMELCFASDGDYRQALDSSFDDAPGPICDQAGKALGQHRGIRYYTIGQRRGLGLGGGVPYYVLRIEPAANRVVVGTREHAYCHNVSANRVNILAPDLLQQQQNSVFYAKLRSCSAAAACQLLSCDAHQLTVRFTQPVFAPAPGQHLVLYSSDGSVVVGGVISSGVTDRC